MNYQKLVREFQVTSEQPVNDHPYKMTKDEREFRENIFLEEFRELKDAIVDEDRVEQMDALADMKYVNDGTANLTGAEQNDKDCEDHFGSMDPILVSDLIDLIESLDITEVNRINFAIYMLVEALGFSLDNFKTALQRVHFSNMSKFAEDSGTAEKTKEYYASQGVETEIKPVDKKFAIYRKEDGKVLKSVKYYRVYLKDLV